MPASDLVDLLISDFFSITGYLKCLHNLLFVVEFGRAFSGLGGGWESAWSIFHRDLAPFNQISPPNERPGSEQLVPN